MTKKDILDYVMKTPQNTNRAVLSGMLNEISDTSEQGYKKERQTLWEGIVTTSTDESPDMAVGDIPYESTLDEDILYITYDGVEYTCNAFKNEIGIIYGDLDSDYRPVFSKYPFCIISENGHTQIATSEAGDHNIKIAIDTVVTTENFKEAVESVLSTYGVRKTTIVDIIGNGYGNITYASMSPAEALNRVLDRENVIIHFKHHGSTDTEVIYYLIKINESGYMYDAVQGKYTRFQSQWYQNSDNTNQTHPLDIFIEDNTNTYYWVYSEYWEGRWTTNE